MSDLPLRILALHLFGLCAFAISQPIYSTLATSPEFFVAHRASTIHLVTMVLVLTLAIPGFFALIEAIAIRINRRLAQYLYLAFVGALATTAFLIFFNQIDAISPAVCIGISTLFGVAFMVIYCRSNALRRFTTIASAASVFFPIFFLMPLTLSHLGARGDAVASPGEVTRDVPVVLIVLDEFNPTALLQSDGQIDATRFPNFGLLANDGWWFPKATTTHFQTLKAVPSILTGQLPPSDALPPTAHSYPNNLFTLLGSSYQLNVWETVTNLCPSNLCIHGKQFEVSVFVSDLRTVYLHSVVPNQMKGTWLPSLNTGWNGFGLDAEVESPGAALVNQFNKRIASGRHAEFQNFIERIQPGRGTLDFLHVLLPHTPYEYLPDGTSYDGRYFPGQLAGDAWANDQYLVDLAYHRFILQVGAVDRLIGDLVAKLKSVKKYDDALIVVTADHGKSFTPTLPSRDLLSETAPEILHVPMFLKFPHQTKGGRNDRHVSNVDVLATIASIVGALPSWKLDGVSMVDESFPVRSELTVDGNMSFRWEELVSTPLLKRQLLTFGSQTNASGIAYRGQHSELIGQQVTAIAQHDEADWLVRFEQNSAYPYVYGTIHPPEDIGGYDRLALAFAIDDQLVSVVPIFGGADEGLKFAALLPQGFSQSASLPMRTYVVSVVDGVPFLIPLHAPSSEVYLLAQSETGEELIQTSNGEIIMIGNQVIGYLDNISVTDGRKTLHGWAADTSANRAASRVLIFGCSKFLGADMPSISRPDVGKALGIDLEPTVGFTLTVNSKDCSTPPFRVFATSKTGIASELAATESFAEALRNSME